MIVIPGVTGSIPVCRPKIKGPVKRKFAGAFPIGVSKMSNSPSAFPLVGLVPEKVWAWFSTLCAIPRPSKGEGELRQHLAHWARERGLASSIDGAGNLIIRKPASPGKETAPGVVLQAHLDMVCQKNTGSAHDFCRDSIKASIVDGWLLAQETTLGADNGIGVALIMAVLADDALVHGPIEALLTIDEEAGMGGARGLESGILAGRLMLNLDTEDWGEFYLGCAGGLDVDVQRVSEPETIPPTLVVRRLVLQGLRGGHSGVNIHEERGNANKLLIRILQSLPMSFRLCRFHGGTARNALPREAFAEIAVVPDDLVILHEAVEHLEAVLRTELQGVEAGLSLELLPAAATQVMPMSEQTLWLDSLHAAPHGVHRMSCLVPGIVETSNNLGIVVLAPEGGSCNFMVRSLVDTAAQALAAQIVSLFRLSGSSAECSGFYPGWAPNPASPLLALCQRVFTRDFSAESKVKVVHAGLECGIIGEKYPGMDIVSFGPNIRGAHAPGERVEIASVAKVWALLTAILAEVA